MLRRVDFPQDIAFNHLVTASRFLLYELYWGTISWMYISLNQIYRDSVPLIENKL